MNKTKIEYLDYCWNFYTGCSHNLTECPVSVDCWARRMADRFGRSFKPTLHPEKLLEPLSHKKPVRIGVCFTGDLFGDWVNPDMVNKNLPPNSPIKGCQSLSKWVKTVIDKCPQHQFFFLTKAPQNYQKWGNFPDNAWVGATVCNNKMLQTAFDILAQINTGHGWLSIEPLMERLDCDEFIDIVKNFKWLEWVVIGGWSGGRQAPQIGWVNETIDACKKAYIPVFLKNNLGSIAKDFQELPNK